MGLSPRRDGEPFQIEALSLVFLGAVIVNLATRQSEGD
jgi:hypothetical protein